MPAVRAEPKMPSSCPMVSRSTRIALVDEDDGPVGLAFNVESAGSHRDAGHQVAVHLEKRKVFRQRRFAAIGREIGNPVTRAGIAASEVGNLSSKWIPG